MRSRWPRWSAGVPVLSEKPLAATLHEAVEMVAAADRNERLLMVSQNRRYMPVAGRLPRHGRAARAAVQPHLRLLHRAPRAAPAEFLFAFAQPLLLDMAIHLFDGARAITGADPVSVYCESYEPAVELVRRARPRRTRSSA